MFEQTRDIVVAMINSGLIPKTTNADTNIENVNKAIKQISEQIKKCYRDKSKTSED